MRAHALVCALLMAHFAYAAEENSAHLQHDTPQLAPDAEDPASQSATEHVAPAPPTSTMDGMSDAEMNHIMQMNDNPTIGTVRIDRIEWSRVDRDDGLVWDIVGRYGTDFDKVAIKSEGERSDSVTHSKNELLWEHIVSRWWSLQTGIRYDSHEGPSRTWAAFGMHGLAAYWFDVDASVYIGDAGRTALRVASEYELLLTQRWILQPRLELNAYGKQDAENDLGAGVSDGELGLRLRYEIRRELAPYLGVSWTRRFGETAHFAQEAGIERDEVAYVLGLRAWF